MSETSSVPPELREPPLFEGDVSAGKIDDQVLGIQETFPPRAYWLAVSFIGAVATLGLALIWYTLYMGIGVWGNNRPCFWAFAIINFVFWIGIGHAGTLISAILLLLRQHWRSAISRFAEAMTIFAVSTAGIFPLLHLGRPWLFYWLLPYPNQRGIWPNFRSPLMWDFAAVSTYLTVSILFWYQGMIPDMASLRDRAKTPLRRLVFNILSFGWRGSAAHWRHSQKAYVVLGGLATGLVLSVHSVVSFDFAVSVVPGWHMTIFPPYFVTGAIFAGFAMVILGMVVVRNTVGLRDLVTMGHMEVMCKLVLTMSCLMAYAYACEGFIAWYSNDVYTRYTFWAYLFSNFSWAGWLTISCNCIIPQAFWFRSARTSIPLMSFVSLGVLVGMWFERFVIIVGSLRNDFLPAAWHTYRPTWVDLGILAGSFAVFTSLTLLFARGLPLLDTSELKARLPGAQVREAEGHD